MHFEQTVIDELKSYIYRLIDPRNGETFYVGKGKGNRVFQHVEEERVFEEDEDELTNKLKRIRDIKIAGLEVGHVIHRHGMDDKTAKIVEAALIDAYPGLTNIMSGTYSGDYGVMHTKEVISRYAAQTAVFQHRVLLINVNKSSTETSLYDAVRYAWKINIMRANEAEVILATFQGLIIGAFQTEPPGWIEATAANFPGRETINDRYGFIGRKADKNIINLYVGKQVPSEYRKPGAAFPIRYTW